MGSRPVFMPVLNPNHIGSLVSCKNYNFVWQAGLSLTQKQKNIINLHDAVRRDSHYQNARILEISSKSKDLLGVRLSAFNLTIKYKGYARSVESVFQSSKVFRDGGPYTDLLLKASVEAKRDLRLKNSGPLIKFMYDGQEWEIEPKTMFYDWLYIQALLENPYFADQLLQYDAFTDIEFNPQKSINCQAHAAALYVALKKRYTPVLQNAKEDVKSYKMLINSMTEENLLFK